MDIIDRFSEVNSFYLWAYSGLSTWIHYYISRNCSCWNFDQDILHSSSRATLICKMTMTEISILNLIYLRRNLKLSLEKWFDTSFLRWSLRSHNSIVMRILMVSSYIRLISAKGGHRSRGCTFPVIHQILWMYDSFQGNMSVQVVLTWLEVRFVSKYGLSLIRLVSQTTKYKKYLRHVCLFK